MTTKMYSYKRERAKRLYPEPAIFNKKSTSEVKTFTRNERVARELIRAFQQVERWGCMYPITRDSLLAWLPKQGLIICREL